MYCAFINLLASIPNYLFAIYLRKIDLPPIFSEQNGLTLNPHVFSFDKTPNTEHYLNKRIVDFVMDQQPFLMGYLSVTQLVLLNQHHVTPVDVNTAN